MMTSVMKPPKLASAATVSTKKRKQQTKVTISEPKNIKVSKATPNPKRTLPKVDVTDIEPSSSEEVGTGKSLEDVLEKYPILKDELLINKFLNVPMNNNQKGRIRQQLKDHLKGASDTLLPEIIHHRIQTILKSSPNLSDTDLRKLRILYNMLKTAALAAKSEVAIPEEQKEKKKPKIQKKENKEAGEGKTEKVKGPKRYVVYVGNLPLDITKPALINNFWEISDYIKDVRIPKRSEEKKLAIAYVELANETSFELALSKHHSMLSNKRINVLYSTQKKTSISKSEAKGKTAKMVALQKTGKLIGSIPLNRKRSHRRKLLKQARAKKEEDAV